MRAALDAVSRSWACPHPPVTRALLFGTAWGMGLGLWLVGLAAWRESGVCLPGAAATMALSLAGGIPTMGLFAALTPHRSLGTAQPRIRSGAVDLAGRHSGKEPACIVNSRS